MTPQACVNVLRVLAAEPSMPEYTREALLQSAAYITETEHLADMLGRCTSEMERAGVVAESAAAEIQRLNLEIQYLRSGC